MRSRLVGLGHLSQSDYDNLTKQVHDLCISRLHVANQSINQSINQLNLHSAKNRKRICGADVESRIKQLGFYRATLCTARKTVP